jgi:hypothetical protein
MVTHYSKITGRLLDVNTGDTIIASGSDNNSKVDLELGMGVFRMLSNNFGITVGGSFDLIPLGREEFASSPEYAYIFDIKVAATFLIH